MRVRKKHVSDVMRNWITLNEAISGLNREEVLFAMELENERAVPRKTVVKRLSQRYNGIRGAEIREELKDGKSNQQDH